VSEGNKPFKDLLKGFTPLVPHTLKTSGDPILPEPPIQLTDPAAIVIEKLVMTNILLDRVNYSLERLLDKLDKE
jgi:hypothetical protein